MKVKRWAPQVKHLLNFTHFETWMKDYPELAAADCIIEVFHFADQPTQKKVFELVAQRHRDYYCKAWAHLGREEFLASLLRWHQIEIAYSVLQHYDPTFLTWIGLRFNHPKIYEKFYPLADHDQVRKMLDGRVFEEQEREYWDLDYYKNQRDNNFETLARLQATKLHSLLQEHGSNQRKKI